MGKSNCYRSKPLREVTGQVCEDGDQKIICLIVPQSAAGLLPKDWAESDVTDPVSVYLPPTLDRPEAELPAF